MCVSFDVWVLLLLLQDKIRRHVPCSCVWLFFSVFVICFGPTNVLLLIHYIHFSYNNSLEYLYFAYVLCVCISSVSCCIDPFIYYYASSQYQRQLFSLLSCKETLDPNSSNSSGQSMSSTSRRGTCSTNANNSVYSKLLVIQWDHVSYACLICIQFQSNKKIPYPRNAEAYTELCNMQFHYSSVQSKLVQVYVHVCVLCL